MGPVMFTFKDPDRKKALAHAMKACGDSKDVTRDRKDAMSWMCSNEACKSVGLGKKGLQACGKVPEAF
jgi:hypothetical protein